MGHFHEPAPLNGADAYDASLMNPFAFSDEELLLHVTPEQPFTERDGYLLGHNPVFRSRNLHIPGVPASASDGLVAVPKLLDAGEATSTARPRLFSVSEALSKSTSSPGSPPKLASGTCNTALHQSHGMSESQACDLEPAESRDCLEDPADHREKNRVAQKKFRARQKVCVGFKLSCILLQPSTSSCTLTWLLRRMPAFIFQSLSILHRTQSAGMQRHACHSLQACHATKHT